MKTSEEYKLLIIERANRVLKKKPDLIWKASEIAMAIATRIPYHPNSIGYSLRWGLKNHPSLCQFEGIKMNGTVYYRWKG